MEFLEAVPVFHRRNLCLFHSAFDAGLRDGGVLLRGSLSDDCVHHCPQADIRRSGIGLALSRVHHPDDQRRTVLLHGNIGPIPCKDLYGGEKAPHLSCAGELLGRLIKSLNEFLAVLSLFLCGFLW